MSSVRENSTAVFDPAACSVPAITLRRRPFSSAWKRFDKDSRQAFQLTYLQTVPVRALQKAHSHSSLCDQKHNQKRMPTKWRNENTQPQMMVHIGNIDSWHTKAYLPVHPHSFLLHATNCGTRTGPESSYHGRGHRKRVGAMMTSLVQDSDS